MSLLALGMIALAAGNPCQAVDYQPGDWLPLLAGTNVLAGYAAFATRNQLDNTLVGEVPDSHLNSEIGIARFLHYDQILGHTIAVQALLPFGSLNNGMIDGRELKDASGIGDPIVGAFAWLINDPTRKRYVSVMDSASIPIGTYDRDRALNLGNHRWENDVQVDLMQGVSNKITVDISASWVHSWPNNAAGTGHQTLSQSDTLGTYLWISYDVTSLVHRSTMPSALPASLSVGYVGIYGGQQRLDGVRTGAAGGEQQIRLTYSQFVTPSWQGLISVTHDVNDSGQFKQDIGVLLRVAKLF